MSASTLKIIAAILMVIDHIGYFLFPHVIELRIIGRLSFPIFAFLIANGYRYTKDVTKYFKRLFVFACIIQIPSFFTDIPVNVIFTFCFGLGLIIVLDSKEKPIFKGIIVVAVLLLSILANADYGMYGVVVVLLIHHLDGKYVKMFFSMVLLSFIFYGFKDIQVVAAVSVIFMYLYNKKRGLKIKYFFYIFYPLHIIILYGISSLFR